MTEREPEARPATAAPKEAPSALRMSDAVAALQRELTRAAESLESANFEFASVEISLPFALESIDEARGAMVHVDAERLASVPRESIGLLKFGIGRIEERGKAE